MNSVSKICEAPWLVFVDLRFGGATPPGTARRPRLQARAVPGESVASVTEINALSQEEGLILTHIQPLT